ncbi:amino acid adenylation domain-containing protein [Streptomyces sp. J2-1]|uniref:non-ribosomal peptide synthetase n=1 Tax=Streptomyces corallincola TaxID=2851888 RepID=UPI001C384F76|nr:non-ribosomal peptide synthetase [Streptomyces corallincola]MBV2354021.1 amino acid adenylation domain-containing protein [Streptomyces corallincola]
MTAGPAPAGAPTGGDIPTASFAQRRLWFLDQLAGPSAGSTLPLALRLRGPLDADRLERSLAAITERHELLRTRFTAVDGEPVPVTDPPAGFALERTDATGPDDLFARHLGRPLDLAVQHPVRAVLARVAPDEHLLLVEVHHIAVDGWSWGILLDELAAGYRGETVTAPGTRYADLARAEAGRLSGDRLRRLTGHWRDRLAGLAPLALPTDRPRPRVWDGSGAALRFDLPADLVTAVDTLARSRRATRYMLLLTAYQALLGHWSGTTDVAVCSTLADRGRRGAAELIGPLVNTVVLRTDLSGRPGFADLLDRVRGRVLTDLSHAEAPFDHVVGAVGGERDLSRHPLAQASFTLLNSPLRPVSMPGLAVELVEPPLTETPLDVFLDLTLRTDGSIAAVLQYATALFDPATMRGFADSYVALLRAVLDAPDTPVGELAAALPLLASAARPRPEWHRASDRPAGPAEPVRYAGAPDATALICGDDRATYAELDALTGGLAAALAATGVVPGSRVGVLLRRGLWSAAAVDGVWRAGGVYVPLDPELPPERLRFMAEEADLGWVVADAANLETAHGLAPAVVDTGTVTPVADAPRHIPDPRELAHVIFTSGSTGRPKAVGVEHAALASHVAAARARFGITAADRVLAFASFAFDASLDQLLPALTCGATVVMRPDEPWLPTQVPEIVQRHALTVVNVPPTYWAELTLSLDRRLAAALTPLRLLVLGGEAVPADTLALWRAAVPGVRVCNAYGPTETTVTATTYDAGDPPDGAVPIGRPLGGRRVHVVDPDGTEVPVGATGELLIGGTELARGYLGRPALTAERFVPDPFGAPGGRLYRTGDLVRWGATGDLEFLGRRDDQVKIRGFRVELGEVETVLRGCPQVAAAAVRPDRATGRSLVGYVVPADAGDPATGTEAGAGPAAVDRAALRAWCARHLPGYAVPSEFVVLDALPVGVSGKLDRNALPDPAHARSADAAYVAPRDATERVVAEVWADVLGVDRIGIDDSFFDLGGHSLLATMAVSRIAQRLGREIELRTVFEHPTVRGFAPRVAAARLSGTAEIVPADRTRPLPLSFAQERLWFLDRTSDHGESYLLWYSWRVRGGLDRTAWQQALDDLVARHEVLRTALIESDGRPVQQICDPVGVPLLWESAPDAPEETARLDAVRRRAVALATRRFDLARPPLLRAGVWELADDDHVLVLSLHHAVTDGWSKGVLLDELTAHYRARLTGGPAPLAELPVQYADFAAWQRERADNGALEPQLAYWEEALADAPALELPTDRPRPPAFTGRGGAVEVELDTGLVGRVDAFARQRGASRFMVLLAAAQAVLARWTGQTDVSVGTPVAGRDRVELEPLIGYFVNTVVLRTDLAGRPAFSTLVDRVRDTVLGAFDHQEVPFERVVERLRPARDLSRNPLFQVMVDVQDAATGGTGRLPGLDTAAFELPWGSAKFDLTATFLVRDDRFALNIEYAADLFDADSAARFARHVGRLLAAALTDPTRRVDEAPLLTAGEHRDLVAAAGHDSAPAPAFSPAGHADRVAVVCGDHRLEYAELDALTGGLAADLVAAGVAPGDPVGVRVGRSVWSVAAMLAVWRAGGVYVPLDTRLPAERTRLMLAETGARHIVTDPGTRDGVTGLDAVTVDVGAVTPAADGPRHTPAPDDLAYVIFTSGSTGRPKAVGVEHHALDAHVATARAEFALTEDDRVLSFASTSFDASLEQLLPALAAGATVVVRPEEIWAPEELAERVAAERITVMELTPSYWAEVVARIDTLAPHLTSLRLLVTGGEALPADPLARWFAALPQVPVVNTYGPTETVISATARRVEHAPEGRVPIGRALGSRRAHVVDPLGNLVPDGVPGELLIGGPELARGYLGRPALTAERFVPDPFGAPGGRLYRTGDVVRRLPGGELEFLGRNDDQVKIRGFRVEPGEAEAVLRAHPGVRAAAVLVRPLHGEPALIGYAAGDGLSAESLATHCRAQLPHYLVPSAFVLLDRLPLTVQGKLDTAALPAPAAPAARAFTAPRTPAETVVAQIWCEVLDLPRIGVHDDFFALGGHSLRAVSVASRLRTAFDCPLQVRDVFEHPTVERLAAEVERRLLELISQMSDDEIDLSLTADF